MPSKSESKSPLKEVPPDPSPQAGKSGPRKSRPKSKTYSEVKARKEAAVKGSSALGQKARKVMKKRLLDEGVKKERLPAIFRDKEVARSRKSPAGQIVVRDMSGIVHNAAARIARKFENNLTDGKDDIIEKLEMVPHEKQTALQQRLVETMRSNPRWSFARAVAESKANLATSMNAYAEGLLAMNKLESLMVLYKGLPHLMRDVMHHAVDSEETCNVCFGVGQVSSRAKGPKLNSPCPRCKGSGTALVSSPHKAMAMKHALEISKLTPEKGPLVAVQQNSNVNVSAGEGSNILERVAKASDELLYGDVEKKEEAVEAELVYPDDLPQED